MWLWILENLLFSCTMHKCCKLIPTAQLLLLPSKVYYLTSRSSLALSLMTARAQAFNVSWTLQHIYAPETIISLLLLQSGTHTVSPRSSFLRIICPLFSWELYKIMHTLSPQIYLWHFSFTCYILPKMEANPNCCCHRTPSEREHSSWSPVDHSYWYDNQHHWQHSGSKTSQLSPIHDWISLRNEKYPCN